MAVYAAMLCGEALQRQICAVYNNDGPGFSPELMQMYGRCAASGQPLVPHDIYCHHTIPLENGGTDEYGNLVLVTEAVHLLIHATIADTIGKYLTQLQLDRKQLAKLNKLRELSGNPAIV